MDVTSLTSMSSRSIFTSRADIAPRSAQRFDPVVIQHFEMFRSAQTHHQRYGWSARQFMFCGRQDQGTVKLLNGNGLMRPRTAFPLMAVGPRVRVTRRYNE